MFRRAFNYLFFLEDVVVLPVLLTPEAFSGALTISLPLSFPEVVSEVRDAPEFVTC